MLWVFHWGRNSFIPPMKHLIYKMKSFFLRIETPFCEIFCIFAVSIKNSVLTLSFAFSKITEKVGKPADGQANFLCF